MDDEQGSVDFPAIWGGWATLAWGLLIAAVFMATQMLVMGLYIVATHGDVSDIDIGNLMEQLQFDGTVISLATIATLIFGSLAIIGIIKLKKHSDLTSYLGLTLPNKQQVRYWFTVFGVLLLLSELLSYSLVKYEPHEFMTSAYTTAEPLWLLWIAMVVAAPIFEELFFRGFLLEGFRHTFMGASGAVLLTSLLWAVIHTKYDLYYIITIFVMGGVLGMARAQTGSVILPIGLHAFVNGLATLQTGYFV